MSDSDSDQPHITPSAHDGQGGGYGYDESAHPSDQGPAGDPPGDEPGANPGVEPGALRQIELIKGGHHYIFRYEAGEEAKLMEDLRVMGQDPQSPMTVFDAAVLSHQLGQKLGQDFDKLMNK